MKLKYPITVYTLYKYDVWIDPNSYEQKLMITSIHPTYKAKLVFEAIASIKLEDLSDLKGGHIYRSISILKNAHDYDDNPVEYVGHINYIFMNLLKNKISYLEVRKYQILTDGSVEY